jgi:hypothetical protein
VLSVIASMDAAVDGGLPSRQRLVEETSLAVQKTSLKCSTGRERQVNAIRNASNGTSEIISLT